MQKGVAEASVLAFQSTCINGAELDTTTTDCFAADGDTALCEQIFDIVMTGTESVVEPDGVGNDVERESVTFACNHPPTLAI